MITVGKPYMAGGPAGWSELQLQALEAVADDLNRDRNISDEDWRFWLELTEDAYNESANMLLKTVLDRWQADVPVITGLLRSSLSGVVDSRINVENRTVDYTFTFTVATVRQAAWKAVQATSRGLALYPVRLLSGWAGAALTTGVAGAETWGHLLPTIQTDPYDRY